MRKTDINGKLVQFAWWALATIVFTLVVAIRIRLLGIPLERDEGEYAYAGQLILQGIPPYKLAYNMKFPGTYAAYAVIMSIFGQTIIGIHIGLLLINVATIVADFFHRPATVRLARRVSPPRQRYAGSCAEPVGVRVWRHTRRNLRCYRCSVEHCCFYWIGQISAASADLCQRLYFLALAF